MNCTVHELCVAVKQFMPLAEVSAGRWMVGTFGPECLILCENVSVAETVKQYLWDRLQEVNNVQTNLCVSEGRCLVLSLFLSLCVQYGLLQ